MACTTPYRAPRLIESSLMRFAKRTCVPTGATRSTRNMAPSACQCAARWRCVRQIMKSLREFGPENVRRASLIMSTGQVPLARAEPAISWPRAPLPLIVNCNFASRCRGPTVQPPLAARSGGGHCQEVHRRQSVGDPDRGGAGPQDRSGAARDRDGAQRNVVPPSLLLPPRLLPLTVGGRASGRPLGPKRGGH